jgi:multiple sugar transport system ATP-binding protein
VNGGSIRIGERDVTHLAPKDRDIAMVFQNYALYPHMTVADNMGFALKIAGEKKDVIRQRVGDAAKILDLTEYLDRKPKALSGGQRQRVAMGRAIVRNPQVFLMDEPLSNLDAKLRVQMRAEISGLQRELNATTIYVTHDQVEAMTMGDRVAVMRGGLLQQLDPPQRLYDRPANLFVATFIGSPSMNLIEAGIDRSDGLVCTIGNQSLAIPADRAASLGPYVGRQVALGVRPERIEHAALVPDCPPERRLQGVVRLTEALGSALLAHVEVEARPVMHEQILEGAADDEVIVEEILAEQKTQRTTLICSFDPSASVSAGEPVELAVDTRRLHFFDLESGGAIEAAA